MINNDSTSNKAMGGDPKSLSITSSLARPNANNSTTFTLAPPPPPLSTHEFFPDTLYGSFGFQNQQALCFGSSIQPTRTVSSSYDNHCQYSSNIIPSITPFISTTDLSKEAYNGYQNMDVATTATTTTTTSTSHESNSTATNNINDHLNSNNGSFFDSFSWASITDHSSSGKSNKDVQINSNNIALDGTNPDEIKWSEYLQSTTPLLLAPLHQHSTTTNTTSNGANNTSYGEIKTEASLMPFTSPSTWHQNQQPSPSPSPSMPSFHASDMYNKDLQRLAEAFGPIF